MSTEKEKMMKTAEVSHNIKKNTDLSLKSTQFRNKNPEP